jgi:serine protease Do
MNEDQHNDPYQPQSQPTDSEMEVVEFFETTEEPHIETEEIPYTQSTHSFYQETVKPPQKERGFKNIVIIALIASLVGGLGIGLGIGMISVMVPLAKYQTTAENTAMETIPLEEESYVETPRVLPITADGTIADIAENVGPSVVSIVNNKTVSTWAGEFTQSGLGSGVIFSEDASRYYIVTNAHVVESATNLVVTFLGNEKTPGSIVGADTVTDIAIVAVKKEDMTPETLSEVRIATLGDSDNLRVGELTVAIGTPVAEAYNNTVTVGVVSALNRQVELTDNQISLIQTDAAINPGNSGGALVGPTGEVIGINTLKLVEEQIEGMGFALSINDVKPILEELMQNGRIIRPSLGITGKNMTESIGKYYSIPVGIIVVQVVPGSSAELAGLQVGDIILEFDNQKITTMDELKQCLRTKKIGDTVTLKLLRGNGQMDLSVKLYEMPDTNTSLQ